MAKQKRQRRRSSTVIENIKSMQTILPRPIRSGKRIKGKTAKPTRHHSYTAVFLINVSPLIYPTKSAGAQFETIVAFLGEHGGDAEAIGELVRRFGAVQIVALFAKPSHSFDRWQVVRGMRADTMEELRRLFPVRHVAANDEPNTSAVCYGGAQNG